MIDQLELPLFVPADSEREQVRQMETRTYNCGVRREYHAPHVRPDGEHCAGLQSRHCSTSNQHNHHRWWVIPDAFYWCDGLIGGNR